MHDHIEFIAITYDTGTIGVMQFLKDRREGWCDATDEAINNEIAKSVLPAKPVSWRRIRFEDIPQDRTFRDAWRDTGKNIVHDMNHCKELYRQRLRRLRAPLLAELDVEYQRADESGSLKARGTVVKRKQYLRDITADPRIESAKTPAELLLVTIK